MGEQFIRKRAQAFQVQGDRAVRGFARPRLWSARPEVMVVHHAFDITGPVPPVGTVLTIECQAGTVRALLDAVEVGRNHDPDLHATLDDVGAVSAAKLVKVSELGALSLCLCDEEDEP
ncbi:MAG: hypothetical protein ABL886_02675 [Rhodoglobus sp.]